MADQNMDCFRKCVADVIVMREDKVLLLKPSYRATWQFPGGHIEGHETPRMAAAREALEEIGVQPALERLLCVNAETKEKSGDDALCFVFLGRLPEDAAINVDGAEIAQYEWVSMNQALERLHPLPRALFPVLCDAIKEGRTIYAEDAASCL